MTKLPPIEKVYEAWSAVADGRVSLEGEDHAKVTSSDGERVYDIAYDSQADTYASNDNSTYWQGYPGYPVLAVMMLRGRLPMDYEWVSQWAHINWNQLNKAHKRNYAAAVVQVEEERGINADEAKQRAEDVMSTLQAMPIKVKRLKQ